MKADRDSLRDRRDALLDAALPHIAFDGWTATALRAGAEDLDIDRSEATVLFPGGARDMIAWHSRLGDRRLKAALDDMGLDGMKIRERIAAGVMTRLRQNQPHREAIRRACTILAMPHNAPLSLKLLYGTVDTIWRAAGDTATDWNFYSKRALLGAVYSSTLLCWLNDDSEGLADTEAFLERRIADVMKVPKLTSRLSGLGAALPRRLDAFRRFRRHAGAARSRAS